MACQYQYLDLLELIKRKERMKEEHGKGRQKHATVYDIPMNLISRPQATITIGKARHGQQPWRSRGIGGGGGDERLVVRARRARAGEG